MKQFRIKASESLQNSLAGAIYKDKKMGKRRQKELLKMPKLQEIFTTVAIMCHRYDRLAV